MNTANDLPPTGLVTLAEDLHPWAGPSSPGGRLTWAHRPTPTPTPAPDRRAPPRRRRAERDAA